LLANSARTPAAEYTRRGADGRSPPCADTRKAIAPASPGAAPPDAAEALVARFVDELNGAGVRVETGRFGALMEVELVNDGPVTIVINA
jgi:D-tyrosyl-tRNA(Tyr) deacylase